MKAKWFTAVGVAVAALLFTPVGGATGILDQSQETDSETGVALIGSQIAGQTFTAGRSGALVQIDLLLTRNGQPGDLWVEVWATDGGGPTMPLSTAVPISQMSLDDDPYTFEWVSVPISPAMLVTGSTQYAIVLRDAGGAVFPSDYYYWASNVEDPYGVGMSFTSIDGYWYPAATVDFAFRTYLTDRGCPPVPPERSVAPFQLWNVEVMYDLFTSQGHPEFAQEVVKADKNTDGLMCWAGVRGTAIWIDNHFPIANN